MTLQEIKFALVTARNASEYPLDIQRIDDAIDCLNQTRVIRIERKAALDEMSALGQEMDEAL